MLRIACRRVVGALARRRPRRYGSDQSRRHGDGPRQYYYRIRDVVTRPRAGRDRRDGLRWATISSRPARAYSLPPWIAELPIPSALGWWALRTWLLVNRLACLPSWAAATGRSRRVCPAQRVGTQSRRPSARLFRPAHADALLSERRRGDGSGAFVARRRPIGTAFRPARRP